MDEETRREIILEHYMQPLHKHKTDDASYEMVNTNNSSCIDNLDIYVQIKDNKITNIMNYAFDYCHNLRSVYLPCCNSIGDRAFRGCSTLCDVTLQSGCEFNSDSTTLRTFYECKMLDHIKYSTESEESST